MKRRGEVERNKKVEAEKRGSVEMQKIYLSINYESGPRIQQPLREHANSADKIHSSPSSSHPQLAYL